MAIPRFENPAFAAAGAPQVFGRPEQQASGEQGGLPDLDREMVDLIGDRDQGAEIARITAQPPQGQQGPLGSGMDWRARAAQLMRKRMAAQSNQQGQPAWMQQRG